MAAKRFPVMLTEPQIQYLHLDAHEHYLEARDGRSARSWDSISRAAAHSLRTIAAARLSAKRAAQ